ncbi:hypothetical protein [Streptomyces collinus]|uniref:hypothetical protein n=1 Tax=Streptomyces collinus TaxID=42684 RepID=UPI00362F8123
MNERQARRDGWAGTRWVGASVRRSRRILHHRLVVGRTMKKIMMVAGFPPVTLALFVPAAHATDVPDPGPSVNAANN